MTNIRFHKKVIAEVNNDLGGYPMNTFLAAGDINGDGWVDLVISGREGRMVWLENPGAAQHPWREHIVEVGVKAIECGGCLWDLTGNGLLDIIVGGGGIDELWWWQNPGIPGQPWQRRTILKTGATQFHDTLIATLPPWNCPALLATNQSRAHGATLYCLPLPEEPFDSPWQECLVVAEGKAEALHAPDGTVLHMQPEEGIAVGDLTGDGQNEIVCGCWWYRWNGTAWEGFRFAHGYVTNKIAVADVDGDGKNEIVLAEGDPVIYGKTQGGKAAWFKPGAELTEPWHEHVLAEGLLDAHTLCAANLCGSGAPDLIIGEIGVANQARGFAGRQPNVWLFENNGRGSFTPHLLDQGTGIHDGVLADLRHTGRLDLLCKPLHGAERWKILVFENEIGG